MGNQLCLSCHPIFGQYQRYLPNSYSILPFIGTVFMYGRYDRKVRVETFLMQNQKYIDPDEQRGFF